MCGLIGAFGNINFEEKKVVKDMLVVDVLRGFHSTGIAIGNMVGKELKHSLFKRAVHAVDFLGFKQTDTMFNKFNVAYIIGHNRWATKGEVNNANAHPFDFPNLVGAHNGTLNTVHALKDNKDFEVDSENLYWDLNHTTMEELYPRLNGALALTWFDKTCNSLFMCRNDKRPLYFVYTKDRRAVFWASEPWMLHAGISRRNGMVKVDLTTITEVKVNTLYDFGMNEKGTISHVVSELQPYKPPVYKPVKKLTDKTKNKEENFVGTRINVSVESRTKGDSSFLTCVPVGDGGFKVRLYGDEKYLDTIWLSDKNIISLTPYWVNSTNSLYHANAASVMAPIEEEKDEEVVEDTTVIDLNKDKKKILDRGCAWCTASVPVEKYHTISMLSDGHNDWLCEDCAKDKDVLLYLQLD